MNAKLSSMFVVLVAVASGFSSEAFAQPGMPSGTPVYVVQTATVLQMEGTPSAARRTCASQRPDIASGSRVTLFANFLRQEAGVVILEIGGTSLQCELIEWQPDSVTVDLPRLGLAEPKNAEITIVLPDGRIAKTFKVRYVRQPDIVLHEDSIPQPMPPLPTVAGPANYVVAVQGGFTLYGN